jgi:plasmid replication initiation protein
MKKPSLAPAPAPKPKRLAQHHNLINARYYLESYKLRIFNLLLAEINVNDSEFAPQRIQLTDAFGPSTGGREYRKIKDFLQDIASTTVTIEDTVVSSRGKLRSNFKTYPLFDEAGYLEGESSFTICFNTKLKPFLLNLKTTGCFCLNDLRYLEKLNSFYTQRFYWKLRQLVDFRQQLIQYDELRFMLALDTLEGVPIKYGDISNFKRKVLDVAKNELSKTDLVFDYTIERNRATKAVEAIRIHFVNRTPKQAPLQLLPPDQAQVFARLLKNECSEEQANWTLFKSGIDAKELNRLCYENEVYKRDHPSTNQAARLLKLVRAVWESSKNKNPAN